MLATVDFVAVAGLGWTILVGAIGGIVGGITTGVLIGIWVGRLSGRLEKAEERLAETAARLRDGDARFDTLVELSEKAKVVGRELDALAGSIGQLDTKYQTKELCGERHRFALEISEGASKLVGALNRLSSSIDRAKGLGLASQQE